MGRKPGSWWGICPIVLLCRCRVSLANRMTLPARLTLAGRSATPGNWLATVGKSPGTAGERAATHASPPGEGIPGTPSRSRERVVSKGASRASPRKFAKKTPRVVMTEGSDVYADFAKSLLDVCVPITSSTSCDQPIFVDHATDLSMSSDAVQVEIDWLG